MTKKKPDQFSKLSSRVEELEEILSSKETLIYSLRRENHRLQAALPPPERGLYIFLEYDDTLACSVQTETSTRYSFKISEDSSGLAALLAILRARQEKLTKMFSSDACPSQARTNEMIDEWSKKNKITAGNKAVLSKVEF